MGSAMALAVASARDPNTDQPRYDVIGVELPTPGGTRQGRCGERRELPVRSSDPKMAEAMARARSTGNLIAVTSDEAYRLAKVAVIDVHLDLLQENGKPKVSTTA